MIIPAYNHAEFIEETINSVLSQDWQNLEVIVVDDASTDLTLQQAKSIKSQALKVIELPVNTGAAGAYNAGLAVATGEYLMPLGSDDIFLPGKIWAQVNYLQDNREVDILGTYICTNEIAGAQSSHIQIEETFNHELDLNNLENWIWSNRLAHSSVAIRSSAHKKIGKLRTDSPKTHDWELWLRAKSLGKTITVLPEVLTFHRQVEGSVTHSNPSATTMEYVSHCQRFWDGYLNDNGRHDLVVKNKIIAIERFRKFTDDDRERYLSTILEYLGFTEDGLYLLEDVICENLEVKEYLTEVLEASDYYANKLRISQND